MEEVLGKHKRFFDKNGPGYRKEIQFLPEVTKNLKDIQQTKSNKIMLPRKFHLPRYKKYFGLSFSCNKFGHKSQNCENIKNPNKCWKRKQEIMNPTLHKRVRLSKKQYKGELKKVWRRKSAE